MGVGWRWIPNGPRLLCAWLPLWPTPAVCGTTPAVCRWLARVRQPEPRECILEAVRLSQDPKCGDAWTRLYCYDFSACEGMDHPPFAVDRMDPQSPLVAKQLHELGVWLKAQRE